MHERSRIFKEHLYWMIKYRDGYRGGGATAHSPTLAISGGALPLIKYNQCLQNFKKTFFFFLIKIDNMTSYLCP